MENFSLNVLFSLRQDFEPGEFKNLRLTQDALIHRFIDVKLFYDTEDIDNMSENSFFHNVTFTPNVTFEEMRNQEDLGPEQ